MDVDGFWSLIEAGRVRANGDWAGVPEAVVELLAALPPEEVADFAQLQDGLEWQAYREDLWMACTLVNGGFGSDDLFLYFRDWLLVQGRAVWEAALAEPDSLADLPQVRDVTATDNDFAECEEFLYVASEAWERITGEDSLDEALAERGFEPRRDDPVPAAGEPIEFEERERVHALLPRLSALFYERAAANQS